MFFFFDPLYLIVVMLPAIALMGIAQWWVKSTYAKYSKVANMTGLTGSQVAEHLLRTQNLRHVSIEPTPGELSDHYDPRSKVLRLSPGVYSSTSVAATGIVAHEVGHALQDSLGYAPLRLRAALVPVANIGSQFGPWMAIIGLWMQLSGLVLLGIVFFAGAVGFSLVTLPVELDASRRARQMLQANSLAPGAQFNAASAVLTAAAFTYFASLIVAVMQLAYFVLRYMGMRRDD